MYIHKKRSDLDASVSFGIIQQDFFSTYQEMVVVKFKNVFFLKKIDLVDLMFYNEKFAAWVKIEIG